MAARLTVLGGTDVGRTYELAENEFHIGREDTCDAVIRHSGVSRDHARVIFQDGAYSVVDCESRNHTSLNGRRLAARVPSPLKDRDRIAVCHVLFEFRTPVLAVCEDSRNNSTIHESLDALSSDEALSGLHAGGKLRGLLRFMRAVGQTFDLETLLSDMLDGLFDIFPAADRAIVFLLERGNLAPKVAKHRRGVQEYIQYDGTIVERAMNGRQTVLSNDVGADPRAPLTGGAGSSAACVLCAPLLSREMAALGAVQLDSQRQGRPFGRADVELLTCVCKQVSLSVQHAQLHHEAVRQTRLRKELEFAREVQQSILPKAMPLVPGYDFWAFYQAADEVGGDYYDFFSFPQGSQAVLLGDVSGHGVPAALLMARAAALCRGALMSHPPSVEDAIAMMNQEICATAVPGSFITLGLCVIDPAKHEVTVASAGHPPPIFRRSDGRVEELPSDAVAGLPLGVLTEAEYISCSVNLGPGDCLALFSDGITEATDAEDKQYGLEGVRGLLRATRGKSPAEIGRALIEDVERHARNAQQQDDITLVVLGRQP
ncbi:MAG: SpoIIE family protein phosphatase [Thermoguttaceae bacterium]